MKTKTSIKVAIAAVPYSSNLGDGIIAEALRNGLQNSSYFLDVDLIDISWRENYTALKSSSMSKRNLLLEILNIFPKGVRFFPVSVFTIVKFFVKYRSRFLANVSAHNFIVIGGGHLFADYDLNFPIKLHLLAVALRRSNVPYLVYGVGVSDNWSKLAKALFTSLFKSDAIISASCRDPLSCRILSRYLNDGKVTIPVQQVFDPALAISKFHPRPPRDTRMRKIIGVNVANLSLLDVAGDCGISISAPLDFYVDLVVALIECDLEVALFTNGAAEDEEHLLRVVERLPSDATVVVTSRPKTPNDLIATIVKFDAILAHRLHAHIVAYSYQIPSIGFPWDRKCQSFFSLVSRDPYYLDLRRKAAVMQVLDILGSSTFWDTSMYPSNINEAAEQIDELASKIYGHAIANASI